MKQILCLLACALWIAGCADPSGITDPVVENPKPLELTITSDHLSETQAEDRSMTKGDDQELVLVPATTPDQLWTNLTERNTMVVDTATGRILRLRLSLIPKLERPRDTMVVSLRRVLLEFDSSDGLRLDSHERIFRGGQALIILREIAMGGQSIFYRFLRIDPASSDVPNELRDSVYCKLKLWRTSQRTIVFKLTIQHFVIAERQGQREIRRLRISLLGERPLF